MDGNVLRGAARVRAWRAAASGDVSFGNLWALAAAGACLVVPWDPRLPKRLVAICGGTEIRNQESGIRSQGSVGRFTRTPALSPEPRRGEGVESWDTSNSSQYNSLSSHEILFRRTKLAYLARSPLSWHQVGKFEKPQVLRAV